MNAYQTALEKNISGTPQQIVAVLRSLSQDNIPAARLRRWLSDNELLSFDGSGWFGTLETVTLSADLAMGIRSLKERVLSGDPVRTADPAFAPKVLQIVQGVAQAVPAIAGLVDSFYALDGGRPFKDLTVDQLAASKTAYEQAQAAQQALETLRQRRQQWDAIAADIRSRIESGALVDDAAVVAAVQSALGV